MEDTTISAMDRHHALSLRYDGHLRIVHPHALLREDQTRRVLLHAWQSGGSSRTGGLPEWRNFRLAGIAALTILDDIFVGPRQDFNAAVFRHVIYSI